MSGRSLRPETFEIPKKTEKPKNEKKYKIVPSNIFTSFLIGTLSGVCAETVYYPIEKRYRPHLYDAPKNNPLHLKKYIHVNGVFKDVFNNIFFNCPVTGFVLASYEIMKVPVRNRFPNINPVELAYGAGSIGVLLENSIWLPYSRIHQYRLINNQKQMNFFKSGAAFVKNEGLLKLWKGYWNSYFATMPFLVTFFAFDEIYQRAIIEYNKRNHPEKPIPFYYPGIGSIAASMTSIFITTPLEYLRVSVITKKKLGSEQGKALAKQLKTDSVYKAPRFGVRKISGPVLGRAIANTKMLPKIIQANVKGPSVKTILQKIIFRK